MKCEFCGNTSGKMDSNGGCISCGAWLPQPPSPYLTMKVNQPHSKYNGITGGYGRVQILSEYGPEVVTFPSKHYYMGYDLAIYTPNEIREMLGLPKLNERELYEERCRFGY